MSGSKPERAGNLFKPGDHAPETGMYQAVHHPGHRKAHTVVLMRGQKFPPCRKCDHTVFLLLLTADHISDDPDLGS